MAVLPTMHPRSMSSLIACDGRIPEVRCAPASSIISGNKPTSPFFRSSVDISDGNFVLDYCTRLESVFTVTSVQCSVKTVGVWLLAGGRRFGAGQRDRLSVRGNFDDGQRGFERDGQ